MSNAVVWFYNDLRLADNPALVNAIESGKPVIPIFIWDENDSDLHTGGAAKWWFCLLYTSPSPRDATLSRMPSSA